VVDVDLPEVGQVVPEIAAHTGQVRAGQPAAQRLALAADPP
jgi:hypothetical protein